MVSPCCLSERTSEAVLTLGTGMFCQGVLAQEITPIGTIGHVFWLWNEWIFFS